MRLLAQQHSTLHRAPRVVFQCLPCARPARIAHKLRAASPGASLPVVPAETTSGAVQQARKALRRFREEKRSGQLAGNPDVDRPIYCHIRLPLPHPGDEENVQLVDELQFPGGVRQCFRKLAPLVDELLYGYGATFLGMAEADADGVGVWGCSDMTVVANVNNLTVQSLLKVCSGAYGQQPTTPGHMVVCVNCTWSAAKDVGQFWQRELKQQAKVFLEDSPWTDLYHLWVVQTAAGATGLLFTTWGEPWQLYTCFGGTWTGTGAHALLHTFRRPFGVALRPDPTDVAQILNVAWTEHQALPRWGGW